MRPRWAPLRTAGAESRSVTGLLLEPRSHGPRMRLERAQFLVEESREAVVVVDHDRPRASWRAAAPARPSRGFAKANACRRSAGGSLGVIPFVVPYEVEGRRERLVYLSRELGDLTAYEELRSGFTAAVSHELRTPLALRRLSLLETATLPGEDIPELVAQATSEVAQITELIDEVLFLSELESGARVVALGADTDPSRLRG